MKFGELVRRFVIMDACSRIIPDEVSLDDEVKVVYRGEGDFEWHFDADQDVAPILDSGCKGWFRVYGTSNLNNDIQPYDFVALSPVDLTN